jgi:hypothetical protein
MLGAIIPPLNTPSWCKAQLKKTQERRYLYLLLSSNLNNKIPDNSRSKVTRLRVGRLGFYSRGRDRDFLLVTTSRSALEPTYTLIQRIPCGLFPRGKRCRRVKITTDLQIVSRLSINEPINLLLHTSSWRGAYKHIFTA